MRMPDPLRIGFNVPFHEAIKAAQKRGVVLPEVYYGELQGLARQHAFSVAGVASLDQLEQVRDSLSAGLQRGVSFNKWKKEILENGVLDLPAHRLDNIFRTNIQSNYNRGRWEKLQRTKATRPYLMYDAINDSRVRPAHLALDGIIRPADDSFWNTHAPLNGYRCRCRLISLNERQAQARSGSEKGLNKPINQGKMQPDKGWDYNPGADLTKGVEKAIESRPESKIKTALIDRIAIEPNNNHLDAGVNYVISNGKRLQKSKTEFAYVHDRDGKVLIKKKGRKSAVSFTRDEVDLIKAHDGVEIIHNHPSGGTLSSADFKFQHLTGADVIHAIGHNDVHYRGSMLKNDLFDSEFARINAQTKRKFMSLINSATITIAQAEMYHFEVVNRVLRSKSIVSYQITKNAHIIEDKMPREIRDFIMEISNE